MGRTRSVDRGRSRERQLVDFAALAKELSLDVLVETHHERELDIVLEWLPDVRLIGINNRDLKTFSTDLASHLSAGETYSRRQVDCQ